MKVIKYIPNITLKEAMYLLCAFFVNECMYIENNLMIFRIYGEEKHREEVCIVCEAIQWSASICTGPAWELGTALARSF